jgi:hypothetical protein
VTAPCAEVLVRRAQLTRYPSGCPWCGRDVGMSRSGHQYPHTDLDPAGPLGGWARKCPGSRRPPASWRPDLVVLVPAGGVL